MPNNKDYLTMIEDIEKIELEASASTDGRTYMITDGLWDGRTKLSEYVALQLKSMLF